MTKDEMRIERMLRFTTKAQYRSIATPKQHTSRQKAYKYIKQESADPSPKLEGEASGKDKATKLDLDKEWQWVARSVSAYLISTSIQPRPIRSIQPRPNASLEGFSTSSVPQSN